MQRILTTTSLAGLVVAFASVAVNVDGLVTHQKLRPTANGTPIGITYVMVVPEGTWNCQSGAVVPAVAPLAESEIFRYTGLVFRVLSISH